MSNEQNKNTYPTIDLSGDDPALDIQDRLFRLYDKRVPAPRGESSDTKESAISFEEYQRLCEKVGTEGIGE